MNAITMPEQLSSPRENAVDMLFLLRVLWAQKALIILFVLGFGALGALYAYTATPYYEVKSILHAADLKEFDHVNRLGIYSITPEDALRKVSFALSSYENRQEYFKKNANTLQDIEIPGLTSEQSFAHFNEAAFKMIYPDAKSSNPVSLVGIQLNYTKGLDGVALVNGFVDFSLARVRKQIDNDITTLIRNRIIQLEAKVSAARIKYEVNKESEIAKILEADDIRRLELQDKLSALRMQLRLHRENRIKILNESIEIATALNISKPASLFAYDIQHATKDTVIGSRLLTSDVPLYFMGKDALLAERATLINRKDDDFSDPNVVQLLGKLKLLEHNRKTEQMKKRKTEDLFVPDLSALREEIALLKSFENDHHIKDIVKVDQFAVEPSETIRPNRLFLVLGAMILGGAVGVALVICIFASKLVQTRNSSVS